jgi:hypothetical protein
MQTRHVVEVKPNNFVPFFWGERQWEDYMAKPDVQFPGNP